MFRRLSVILSATLAGAVLFAAGSPTQAQDKFPTRPIRIIVPYAPGGGTDIVSRLVADQMRHTLGQAVVVENKVGGNGIIAIEELLGSKPDGYTVLMGNNTINVLTPLLYPKKISANVEEKVVPFVRLAAVPNVLIASTKDFEVKTFAEFVAYAKKNPGKLRYGSVGVGSFPHFDMEVLAKRAGLEMLHVPNKGGASASIKDVATGDVHVAPMNVATAGPMVKAGNARVLAVFADTRAPEFPDAPSMAELGLPGVGTSQWFVFSVPAGTPPAIQKTLHDASIAALRTAAVQEALKRQGISEWSTKSPQETQEWMRSEFVAWKKTLKEVPIDMEN